MTQHPISTKSFVCSRKHTHTSNHYVKSVGLLVGNPICWWSAEYVKERQAINRIAWHPLIDRVSPTVMKMGVCLSTLLLTNREGGGKERGRGREGKRENQSNQNGPHTHPPVSTAFHVRGCLPESLPWSDSCRWCHWLLWGSSSWVPELPTRDVGRDENLPTIIQWHVMKNNQTHSLTHSTISSYRDGRRIVSSRTSIPVRA